MCGQNAGRRLRPHHAQALCARDICHAQAYLRQGSPSSVQAVCRPSSSHARAPLEQNTRRLSTGCSWTLGRPQAAPWHGADRHQVEPSHTDSGQPGHADSMDTESTDHNVSLGSSDTHTSTDAEGADWQPVQA